MHRIDLMSKYYKILLISLLLLISFPFAFSMICWPFGPSKMDINYEFAKLDKCIDDCFKNNERWDHCESWCKRKWFNDEL